MSAVVKIKNMPDDIYRKLKARADRVGMSVSEYALREIESSLEVPTHQELLERLRSRSSFEPSEPIADIIAAQREGR